MENKIFESNVKSDSIGQIRTKSWIKTVKNSQKLKNMKNNHSFGAPVPVPDLVLKFCIS